MDNATQPPRISIFFFFNDTATTEIYTLSLHDALPISGLVARAGGGVNRGAWRSENTAKPSVLKQVPDRKSTRLNSSHLGISYAVFCLKKKNKPDVDDAHTDHVNLVRSLISTRVAIRGL